MKLIVVFLVVCLCGVFAEGEERTHFLEAFPEADKNAFGEIAVESMAYPIEKVVETAPFENACPKIAVPAPVSDISQLKPGHIKVVMAMGDSITAAMSAKDTNVVNLHEYRGISFGIGADPNVITVPNLLALYTAPGYPIGSSTGIGKREALATNGLNAAASGGLNVDMIGQAGWLVQHLVANTKINVAEDWKVLTVWIGSNNLCAVCKNESLNNAADYTKNLITALDIIQKNVPRVFVNLVANLDITKLYEFTTGLCSILHTYECPCPQNKNTRELVRGVVKNYQTAANQIAAHYASKNLKDFAVVVQPFLIDSPIYDRTYLSAADCFHPSGLAHSVLATALWNSMITPIANKKTSWDPDSAPQCATAETLLYTK
jgi:phospholipase B1